MADADDTDTDTDTDTDQGPREFDADEITLEMEDILCSGKDLPSVMNALIDYCNQRLPSPGWATMRGKPYAAELPKVAEWMTAVLSSTPPDDDVDALYLVIREAGGGLVLSLAGSNSYVTDGADKWSQPTWVARGQDYTSPTLNGMFNLLGKGSAEVKALGALGLGLGWVCIVARDVCATVERSLLLGNFDGRAVVVGFQNGPTITMGVLDDQGGNLGVPT